MFQPIRKQPGSLLEALQIYNNNDNNNHIHIELLYVYIYIYVERERVRAKYKTLSCIWQTPHVAPELFGLIHIVRFDTRTHQDCQLVLEFWMVSALSIAVGSCAFSIFFHEQLCFSLFFSSATMRFCVLRCLHVPASRSFQDKAWDPMALASIHFFGNFLWHLVLSNAASTNQWIVKLFWKMCKLKFWKWINWVTCPHS